MSKFLYFTMIVLILPFCGDGQQKTHSFTLSKNDFLLDGVPLQIISGEMHPARIPVEYWRQRIQMAKAMGCQSVSLVGRFRRPSCQALRLSLIS